MDPNSSIKISISYINLIITCYFFVELSVKVIARGFIFNHKNNKKAYIRNKWNILDFIVLVLSIIDNFSNKPSLKVIKSFRALRALKALRAASKNEQLNLLIKSLYPIISLLGALLLVTGLIIWVVAIFCM